MTELDKKLNEVYDGLVVRKDLVRELKGSAVVPSYVLEYLLGQYCATDDPAAIKKGVETVKGILNENYVHRNEANKVKAEISQKGFKRIIDKVEVFFNDSKNTYEATFSNLDLKKVRIDTNTVNDNEKLLVGGIWCIVNLKYMVMEERDVSPWYVDSLKPIQLANVEFEEYKENRKNFSTSEWLDVLMHSIGFNPEIFSERAKYLLLLRLIPFCERNYNIIELGPKGTGKSHIYSEFSPHGILLSGGEVTVPKLFVNNSNGRIGLVGFWDIVAFDEFAGKNKKSDKSLVDIMKNYMANKSFSRGVETLGAEASFAFVGNTSHTVPYMLKNSDLLSDLPPSYHDSAFVDRIHAYIPGWEFENIRQEMFSSNYGFVIDYLSEMLKALRNEDYSFYYKDYFSLSSSLSTRDKDGINKTFSGLMKLMYPDGRATRKEIEELLILAIESRARVKEQMMRFDTTFDTPIFSYLDKESQKENKVETLEEKLYPELFKVSKTKEEVSPTTVAIKEHTIVQEETKLEPVHKAYPDGASGISYDRLFGPYLDGATEINIQDPYLLNFAQIRNFLELLETIARRKKPEDEVIVKLITIKDRTQEGAFNQKCDFGQMQDEFASLGIKFSFSFDEAEKIHSRSITTDTGWKIMIDRGLDIFLKYNMKDLFSSQVSLQEARKCRAFELTVVRV